MRKGTCRSSKVAPGAPYPYYCATLLILCSLDKPSARSNNSAASKWASKSVALRFARSNSTY